MCEISLFIIYKINTMNNNIDINDDILICPIILDVFEDPITTPCRHTFSKL